MCVCVIIAQEYNILEYCVIKMLLLHEYRQLWGRNNVCGKLEYFSILITLNNIMKDKFWNLKKLEYSAYACFYFLKCINVQKFVVNFVSEYSLFLHWPLQQTHGFTL